MNSTCIHGRREGVRGRERTREGRTEEVNRIRVRNIGRRRAAAREKPIISVPKVGADCAGAPPQVAALESSGRVRLRASLSHFPAGRRRPSTERTKTKQMQTLWEARKSPAEKPSPRACPPSRAQLIFSPLASCLLSLC